MPAETRDLVIERIFDAPRNRVYQAFVDPDQLAAWFGPVGWSVPRETVDTDVRDGGYQRFTMVSDEDPGQRSVVDATIIELIENELLAGEEIVQGIPGLPEGLVMRIRLEFSDTDDGRTRLVLTQGPYSPDFGEMARAGWESSFTKLDTLLTA